MQHQPGVTAHQNLAPAKGDHRGHAGCNAVHPDCNVGFAAPKGVKDRDAGINIAAVAVDTDVDFSAIPFCFHQLTGYVAATYCLPLADIAVKQDAASAVCLYHVKKFAHVRFVYVSPAKAPGPVLAAK